MPCTPSVVDRIVDCCQSAGEVTARRMFGEVGLYLDGRMIAMVCDDVFYVKPTPGGRAAAGPLDEAPPYPGAKPCLVIPEDRWDGGDWLAALLRASAPEIPLPKSRRKG